MFTISTVSAYITFKAGTDIAFLARTLFVKHGMVKNNCVKENQISYFHSE